LLSIVTVEWSVQLYIPASPLSCQVGEEREVNCMKQRRERPEREKSTLAVPSKPFPAQQPSSSVKESS
jgi:hypothetical protein